jgi:hypothetical protein
MQEYNSARLCRDAVQIELRKGGMFCEEKVLVVVGTVGTDSVGWQLEQGPASQARATRALGTQLNFFT